MRHRGLSGLLAAALMAAAVPAIAQSEGPRVTVLDEPATWRERAALVMDHSSLGPALRDHGYYYAGADEIYMAKIVPGAGQPAMVLFDAAQGAFSQNFWPASAVKALASVAALEYLGSLGYAGDDPISAGWFGERPLRSVYEPAIVHSDNHAYDLLVRVAGVDFVNLDFVPRHGLSSVTIGSDLSGLSILTSPSYSITRVVLPEELPSRWRWVGELTVTHDVPQRSASRYYRSNNADLFDLGEVVRRVMLHYEVPVEQRFDLEDGDVAALQAALCAAEPAHFERGARRVLGDDVEVCGKSGWWDRAASEARKQAEGEEAAGDDAGGEEEPAPPPACTDVAVITDPDTGFRMLLAATGGCSGAGLDALAGPAIEAAAALHGTPFQPDGGVPIGVALGVGDGTLEVDLESEVGWVLVSVDGGAPVVAAGRGDGLRAELPLPADGRHVLVVRALRFGVPAGYRTVDFEVAGA